MLSQITSFLLVEEITNVACLSQASVFCSGGDIDTFTNKEIDPKKCSSEESKILTASFLPDGFVFKDNILTGKSMVPLNNHIVVISSEQDSFPISITVRGGYDDYDIWFDTQTLLLYNSTQSETYYIHENFPCTIESMSNPYPDIIHFDEKQRSFYYYYTNETIEEKSFQIVTDFKRNLTFQVKPAESSPKTNGVIICNGPSSTFIPNYHKSYFSPTSFTDCYTSPSLSYAGDMNMNTITSSQGHFIQATTLLHIKKDGFYIFTLINTCYCQIYLGHISFPLFDMDNQGFVEHKVTLRLTAGYYRIEALAFIDEDSQTFALYWSDPVISKEPTLLMGESVFLPRVAIPSTTNKPISSFSNMNVLANTDYHFSIQSPYIELLQFQVRQSWLKVYPSGEAIITVGSLPFYSMELTIQSPAGQDRIPINIHTQQPLEGLIATYISSFSHQPVYRTILSNITDTKRVFYEAHMIQYSFYLKFEETGEFIITTNCSSLPSQSFNVMNPSQYYHMEFECAMNEIPSIQTNPSTQVTFYHSQPGFSYTASITSFTWYDQIDPLTIYKLPISHDELEVTIQPSLPKGLEIDNKCTISGTPTNEAILTEYTIQAKYDYHTIYTTTISFDVHHDDYIITKATVYLFDKPVEELSLQYGQQVELTVKPDNSDYTSHYYVDFSYIPSSCSYNGYQLKGIVDKSWNQNLTIYVKNRPEPVTIQLPVTILPFYIMELSGEGMIRIEANSHVVLKKEFVNNMKLDVASYDEYSITVLCLTYPYCSYHLYPLVHSYYVPFKTTQTRIVTINDSLSIVDYSTVIEGIEGSALPSLYYSINGTFDSYSIQPLPSWIQFNEEGFTFSGIPTKPQETSIPITFFNKDINQSVTTSVVISKNNEKENKIPLEIIFVRTNDSIPYFFYQDGQITYEFKEQPVFIQSKEILQLVEVPAGNITIHTPPKFTCIIKQHGIMIDICSEEDHILQVDVFIPYSSENWKTPSNDYTSTHSFTISSLAPSYGMYVEGIEGMQIQVNGKTLITTSSSSPLSLLLPSSYLIEGINEVQVTIPFSRIQSPFHLSFFSVWYTGFIYPTSIHSSSTTGSFLNIFFPSTHSASYSSNTLGYHISLSYSSFIYTSNILLTYRNHSLSHIMIIGKDQLGTSHVLCYNSHKNLYLDNHTINIFTDHSILFNSLDIYFFNIDQPHSNTLLLPFTLTSIQIQNEFTAVCQKDNQIYLPYDTYEEACSNPHETGYIVHTCLLDGKQAYWQTDNTCHKPSSAALQWTYEITGAPYTLRYSKANEIASELKDYLYKQGIHSSYLRIVKMDHCISNTSPFEECIQYTFEIAYTGFFSEIELQVYLNKDKVCKNLHDNELKYCSEVELVLDFEELVRKNIIVFILMILVLIGVMVYLIKYYKQQMKDFKKRLAEKKNAVRRMNLQLIASVNKPLLTEIVTPTKRIVSSTLGKADIVNVLHMDPTNV